MTRRLTFVAVVALAWVVVSSAPSGQTTSSRERKGTAERARVHARSLEGNLVGDSADRDVSVYLPPGYSSGTMRYPVLYLLHGFTDDDNKWFGRQEHFINVPESVDRAMTSVAARDLIVVLPNGDNRFHGSMYSTSVTIGDWETFITKELVEFIDARYRTLPDDTSRGIAGHSMGGYGALKLVMKYPGIFSAVYALSPCCMVPAPSARPTTVDKIHTWEQLDAADFSTKAAIASAAAWSPNPNAPPFFADFLMADGTVQPLVLAKWSANAPLAMVDQHIQALLRLSGIAVDAGDHDGTGIAEKSTTFAAMLKAYGIPVTFEVYPGTHTSGIAERFEKKVLPFFWQRLRNVQTSVRE